MKKYKILRLLSLLGYWGTCIAAGAMFGVRAALLVVAGASCAALTVAMEEMCEEDEE